jgi:hypothetical protein
MPNTQGARVAAMARLNALRDLMRMELPDRKSDVINDPCDYDPDPATNRVAYMVSPSLRNAYLRIAARSVSPIGSPPPPNWPNFWTEEHEGAECLYLILCTLRDGEKAALDYFASDEIGDIDGDGMNEILDGWGNPIVFIRWPAGYTPEGLDAAPGVVGVDDDANSTTDDVTEMGAMGSDDTLVRTMQTKNFNLAPDPFDPLKVQVSLFSGTPGYLLHPLIVSAGRDKQLEIVINHMAADGNPTLPVFAYSPPATANNFPNPYALVTAYIRGTQYNVPLGTIGDLDNDGELSYSDNISNHDQTSQ